MDAQRPAGTAPYIFSYMFILQSRKVVMEIREFVSKSVCKTLDDVKRIYPDAICLVIREVEDGFLVNGEVED